MRNILIIDDQIEIRENITEILTLAGYSALMAENGKKGIEVALANKPDLIVCDIMMPELDGYGVLHMLRKNPATENTPFIFLTAKTERNDFRKGMEMGADDYLTKPFDDIELLNAVESRLKKSDILKKDYSKDINGLNEFLNEVKGLEVLQKFTEEGEIRAYRKKEEIYKEVNYPKGIYFLSKGKIKTHKLNDFGKDLITGLYKEGDFFGYIALLDDGKYSDSATAMEDSDVCMIPKDEFYSLVYKNAEVSKKFIKMLSNNLREKEEQLIKLAYNSVRKKVADALITLHDRYKKEGENNFTINISREDLANLAGIATETTIRTLSDLKDEKLVDVNVSRIIILNYDKLKKIQN